MLNTIPFIEISTEWTALYAWFQNEVNKRETFVNGFPKEAILPALCFFFVILFYFFLLKFEQIISWMWAPFTHSARGCSQAQWHMQIYVNSAPHCATCCRPPCVITSGGAVCWWEIPVGADPGSRTSISANGSVRNKCVHVRSLLLCLHILGSLAVFFIHSITSAAQFICPPRSFFCCPLHVSCRFARLIIARTQICSL